MSLAKNGTWFDPEGMSAESSERGIPSDTLANRLMLARAYAGHLSIRESAFRTGLGRGAWQNWERGRSKPGLDAVETISARLGVSSAWLIWGGALPAEKLPQLDSNQQPAG